MKDQLIKIIKENPGCVIYYNDSDDDAFEIFSKADYEKYQETQDWDGIESLITWNGNYHGNGYVPLIVDVLAEMLGVQTDSE